MWGAVEIFRYLRHVILGGDGVVDLGKQIILNWDGIGKMCYGIGIGRTP
jgi:hypothetical protein